MAKSQLQIFETESDAWFNRNASMLTPDYHDEVTEYFKANQGAFEPKHILEIGCSNGWRLDRLSKVFPGAQMHGLEPSQDAIDDGIIKYPELMLSHGFSHNLPYNDRQFEIVILGFMMCLVDRDYLLQTVAEVDRVLKPGGHIVIYDFGSAYPYRAKYHHLPDEQVFTYKQAYEQMFIASQLYGLKFSKEYREPNTPAENKYLYRTVVLEKRGAENYPTIS